jgi:hypothetical protein
MVYFFDLNVPILVVGILKVSDVAGKRHDTTSIKCMKSKAVGRPCPRFLELRAARPFAILQHDHKHCPKRWLVRMWKLIPALEITESALNTSRSAVWIGVISH